MDDPELLEVLRQAAEGVRIAFEESAGDRRIPGERPGQYALDLATDAAAVEILSGAGLGIMSEESGRHHPDRAICVVVDPIDGSTNASIGIPWYATSLAAVDADGVRAALVVNLASGTRYEASRGGGAIRDGRPMSVNQKTDLGDAMLALNGYPTRHLGWRQVRVLGASALDICLVAEGAVDGFADCAKSNLGPWDYLGAMLVLEEAGGFITDADGLELVTLDHSARRSPVAASSEALLAEMLDALGPGA